MPGLKREPSASRRKPSVRRMGINALILLLAIAVITLAYSLVNRTLLRPPVQIQRAGEPSPAVIQLDVLNGCGASGAATLCTSYLRARGYDVVEVRNYRSFDVDESLVVYRVGNTSNAERVAYALGIKKQNILQQINPDYYVDVSVVIGKDYRSLKPQQ